jgi:hypothetical protein
MLRAIDFDHLAVGGEGGFAKGLGEEEVRHASPLVRVDPHPQALPARGR